MDTPNQLSFFDLTHRYAALTKKGDPLELLAQHIPWARFRKTLEKSLRRSKRPKGCRPPFDAILMFKVLVLQALYNLSDDQTEYQIRDRLSFMRFLGLDLHQRIPEAKTIWLFREALTQAEVVEKLFTQFDPYLAGQGFQARGGQLIDASLLPVPTQRNTREENATVKAGECPAEWAAQPAKRCQKDTEARWTKKHGRRHYGYKNHVNVDKPHKLIRRYAGTDAAYRSAEIEGQLKKRKLRSKIHYKGYREKPLTPHQKKANQDRFRLRARVEHIFGHHVTAMQGKLIRTIGRVRARTKIGLKNLTYNLQRFLVLTATVKAQPA